MNTLFLRGCGDLPRTIRTRDFPDQAKQASSATTRTSSSASHLSTPGCRIPSSVDASRRHALLLEGFWFLRVGGRWAFLIPFLAVAAGSHAVHLARVEVGLVASDACSLQGMTGWRERGTEGREGKGRCETHFMFALCVITGWFGPSLGCSACESESAGVCAPGFWMLQMLTFRLFSAAISAQLAAASA